MVNYHIGQIRKPSDNSKLFTTISPNIKGDISLKDGDEKFKEYGITTVNGTISSGINYFLDLKIERKESNEAVNPQSYYTYVIQVVLLNEIENKYQIIQTLDTWTVAPSPQTGDFAYFTLNFTPSISAAYIGLVLNRVTDEGVVLDKPARLLMNAVTIQRFGIVENIFTTIGAFPEGVRAAEKIGVQSSPGFLMSINGESMRVGQSGLFEINNGMKITSFGTPDLDTYFILDYAYIDKT